MAKVTPITEHFQHFLSEMKESFWGDLQGETQLAWKRFSSCSRSGSATVYMASSATNGRRGRGRTIATATTSGIS